MHVCFRCCNWTDAHSRIRSRSTPDANFCHPERSDSLFFDAGVNTVLSRCNHDLSTDKQGTCSCRTFPDELLVGAYLVTVRTEDQSFSRSLRGCSTDACGWSLNLLLTICVQSVDTHSRILELCSHMTIYDLNTFTSVAIRTTWFIKWQMITQMADWQLHYMTNVITSILQSSTFLFS
jgi:hypothetical protein